MAVIVSNKTFPNACIGCDYQDCDFYDTAWNRAGESHINYTNSRAVNCPMKSIDGLIKKIEQDDEIFMYTKSKYTAETVIPLWRLRQIIKEYCGGEE